MKILAILLTISILVIVGMSIVIQGRFATIRGGDSPRFVDGVINFKNNLPLVHKQWSHVGYITFLWVWSFVDSTWDYIHLAQIGLYLIALVGMFRIGTILKDKLTGFLIVALVGLNIDLAQWQVYILSDPVFVSLAIISLWLALESKSRPRYALYSLLIALVCGLTRTNGWLVFMSSIVFQLRLKNVSRWWLSAFLIAGMGLTLATSLPNINDVGSDSFFKHTEIIWGYPQLQSFLPLPIARIIAEYIRLRPYYDWKNNLILLAWYLPLYVFAWRGWRENQGNTVKWFIIPLLAMQTILIAITFADWNGRFWMYMVPFVSIYSALGIRKWLKLS